MKYLYLFICIYSITLFSSCKDKSALDEQPLKVMTFNIRLDVPSDSINNWELRKEDVGEMIAYYQPDLMGLQEVCHNQMEDLKKSLPQYTALGVGRDDGKEAGEYCPIFFNSQRFILVDYGNFALSEQPEVIGAKGWDASYNRVTTWSILQEKRNDKKFIFLNTHLDNDGETARNESAHLILKKIKDIAPDIPAIITGDFNCTPNEEPLQILENGGMQNVTKLVKTVYGPLYSFHDFGTLPLEECVLLDYIITNGATVDRYRVIQDTPERGFLSDHYPVIVDLTFH